MAMAIARVRRVVRLSRVKWTCFATSAKQEQPQQFIPIAEKESGKSRPGLIFASAGLALVATYAGIYAYSLRSPSTTSNQELYTPKMPKISLGGPFKLITQDGKTVTEKDFLGKWTLIYFGYTHCPEDCPKQLQMVSNVVKVFEAAGQEIVPIFISVDPDRDNANQLKMYLKEFHPKFVGLTGSESEIKSAVWRFRVFFKKTAEEDASDYLVDHSNNVYLMNPNMECVRCCGSEYCLQGLVDTINKEMKKHQDYPRVVMIRAV